MSDFIERTFQLVPGVGAYRERALWAEGIATWADFRRAASKGTVVSAATDGALLARLDQADQARARGDVATLAGLMPAKEHWRLYSAFADQTVFFDIEADGESVPTVVGLMDAAGVASFRRGLDLPRLPERLARSALWVTFNGAVFDVPVLHKHFEAFPAPAAHIDLRFLVRRTHLKGGLKGVEAALGYHRPPHLTGVKGVDAIRLWREWTINHRVDALRILLEYNLYDAVNLRCVLEWCMWRVAEINAWSVERRPIFERGDVLYDVSRLVLDAGADEPPVSGS